LVIALDDQEYQLIKRLTDRLERLSADSSFAHRASGLRGSLLHYIERIETGDQMVSDEKVQLDELVEYGFEILMQAAKEIGASR
jgi:hypothetical protein